MKKLLLLLPAILLLNDAVRAQYCMLSGRTSYSANQPGITSFKLNNIDRTSGNVEKPFSQPSLVETGDTTELALGKTYTITMVHTRDAVVFPNARNNIRVWVDYDQNFDFTGTGETVITENYHTAGTFTATFTVPMDAKLGYTRMRATAKMSDDAGHTVPTPCDEPRDPIDYHGEMEDYTLHIVQFPTAVNNINSSSAVVTVSPNPTGGLIKINLDNKASDAVNISIVDVAGKTLATPVQQSKNGSDAYVLDMNQYVQAPGVYFVKVTLGTATTMQKVIKTN